MLTSWNIRKRNGNASFAAEVFSVSAFFAYTKVRRQSSNTYSVTDPTFPFLLHLRYTNLPFRLRIETCYRAGTLTGKILSVQARQMHWFMGGWAQESVERTNTENTAYCQTLTWTLASPLQVKWLGARSRSCHLPWPSSSQQIPTQATSIH